LTSTATRTAEPTPPTAATSSKPLRQFDDWINVKLAQADTAPTSHSATVPIVSYLDLVQLATNTSETVQEQRQDLVKTLQQSGGFVLLDLQPDNQTTSESQIVRDLWNFVDYLYQVIYQDTGADASMVVRDSRFRHQTLTRSHDAAAHFYSGYAFVQTSLVHGTLCPPWLAHAVGTMGSDQLVAAYQMLGRIGRLYTTAVLAGYGILHDAVVEDAGTNVPGWRLVKAPDNSQQTIRNAKVLQQSRQLVDALLDDDNRMYAGAYHRLARYLPVAAADTAANAPRESLRSHADWTLATNIPVSRMAGLEIYQAHQWIQPEAWVQQKQQPDGLGKASSHEHSRYVVLMTGKWLEIVTAGRVESCIHRVVSNPHATTQRISVPFFMRPKDAVFQLVKETFDHDNSGPDDYQFVENQEDQGQLKGAAISREAAVAGMQEMSQFLQRRYGQELT
jgi:isopenicillin N synthase-like dioxygenase